MNTSPVAVSGDIPQINTLGTRLRVARTHSGLSMQELAERAGLNRNTIARAEAGHSPSRATVILWALGCGVDSDWLLTGEVEK